MDKKEKLKMLQKLDEKTLTKEFLIQLFEKMGFKNVVYNHGVLEYGKDIIFCEETKFHKQKYVGVQAKKGDINTEIADKIFCQVTRGLGKPFVDLSDNNKEKSIDEFIILSSGEIKENARENLSQSLKSVNIDKPISFITGEELVNHLDEYMPSAFWNEYDYFNKYFNAMKNDFETIKDISAIGQKEPIPLEDIYVSLKLCEKIREREISIEKEQMIFEVELMGRGRKKERLAERENIIDAERAIKDYNKLVIVGVPGSGKTTLLKHLALKSCKENLEKQERTCVPIHITLRPFLESRKRLREYIDEVFENYKFPKAKEFVEKDLREGKCRLLLDGFDELATKETQKKIVKKIQKFVEKYPKNQIVVTSRIAGYQDELRGFTRLELMEFNDNQIERFIENWFEKTDPEKAKSMFDAIKENEQIKAIARNPLMIAIIAIIYEEDRALPQKRAAVYELCVDVLLSRWDKQKKLKNVYTPGKKEFILRKLAFYGHINNKRIMTEGEVMDVMREYFPQINLKKDDDAKPFLDETWQRSYLLKQISMDSYDFLHLSFQEYFTALELKDLEDGISIIIKHLNEPWWEEPILLYAGISRNATALIKRIKKDVPEDIFYSNLMLFGKCVADADFTKPSLRKEIVNDLWSLYKTAEFTSLREKAISVLALIKPDHIIDSLINDLVNKEAHVQGSAADVLGRIGGEKAIEPLIKALNTHKDRDVRKSAADALGFIGNEKTIESLIKALNTDKENNVRESAADALGRIGSEKAIEPLIKALNTHKKMGVRFSAAIALGSIGSEKAVEPLIKTLNTDKEMGVQLSATIALGGIESEKAIEPLVKALNTHKEMNVRFSAAIALGRIRSEEAIEPLIKALTTDKEMDVRLSAAIALGFIGSEKVVEPLIKALNTHKEMNVRFSAAMALGRIGSEKAIEPLIKALNTHKEMDVRGRAAMALGGIGSEKAVGPLIKALTTHKEMDVRGNAASALGKIGSEKAVEPLIAALKHSNASVRGSSTSALGEIGSEKAIEPLKSVLKDESEYLDEKVKDKAFASLEKISRKSGKRITIGPT